MENTDSFYNLQSIDEMLMGQPNEEPEVILLDLDHEEIKELVPEYMLPEPEFSIVAGEKPDDPMIITSEVFVPVPIMIVPPAPEKVSASVEGML